MPSGIKSPWPNFQEWKAYGLSNEYQKRTPTNLAQGESKEERSWYNKGSRGRWLKFFNFDRVRRWPTFEEWRDYGLEHRYDERALMSLSTSKSKEERSWYVKGANYK